MGCGNANERPCVTCYEPPPWRPCQRWHVGGCASHTLVNMRSTEDVRRRAGSGSCNPRFTRGNAAESLQAWLAEARESEGEREGRLEEEEEDEDVWSLGEGQMFDRTGTSEDRENTGAFIHHKRGMQGTASLLGGAAVFIFKRQKICLTFCQKRKKSSSFSLL